jgi:hypothetical protein
MIAEPEDEPWAEAAAGNSETPEPETTTVPEIDPTT